MAWKPENPFAGSRDYRKSRPVFDTPRLRTPEEAANENRYRTELREHGRDASLEHLHSVRDLYDHLNEHGHADACLHVYSCDPWKYEPILLDQLIQERIGANDEKKKNTLRGLIRAGSWMTYERGTINDATTNALNDLTNIIRIETQRSLTDDRFHDPDTRRMRTETTERQLRELRSVADALRAGRVGADVETETQTVEDLCINTWKLIKGYLAARRVRLDEARKNPIIGPAIQEMENLRRVRDLLYYRRVYPSQAKRSLDVSSKSR